MRLVRSGAAGFSNNRVSSNNRVNRDEIGGCPCCRDYRRGDRPTGPSRGLAPKADGAGWLREMARALKVDVATNGG